MLEVSDSTVIFWRYAFSITTNKFSKALLNWFKDLRVKEVHQAEDIKCIMY